MSIMMHGKRRADARGAAPLMIERFVEAAAVGDTRQAIGRGEALQFLVEAFNAAVRSSTSDCSRSARARIRFIRYWYEKKPQSNDGERNGAVNQVRLKRFHATFNRRRLGGAAASVCVETVLYPRWVFATIFRPNRSQYAAYRPVYPQELAAFLAQAAPGRSLAWDVATGQGQAARLLAREFRGVVATDASAGPIAERLSLRRGRVPRRRRVRIPARRITAATSSPWRKRALARHDRVLRRGPPVLRPRRCHRDLGLRAACRRATRH
jgi:hypothetical protein